MRARISRLARRRAAGFVALAICVACSSPKPNPPQNGSGTAAGSAPTLPEDAMKQPIQPADALLAWLNKIPRDTPMRMPVLVTIADNRTFVEKAMVGDLEIDANDSQMGVPIAGKWGFFCKQGNTCLLLLEGQWMGGKTKEFQVREIKKAIGDAEQAELAFAEVIK